MGSKQNVTLPPGASRSSAVSSLSCSRSGIGSEEAVDIPGGGSAVRPCKDLLTRLHASLLQGAPLSRTGGLRTFPSYMVRMVEIGQAAGRLDQVLSALRLRYRRELTPPLPIRRAVLYPP